MFRGDTNYLLPYKTNSKAGTEAHIGLNHSVYAVLWLKINFYVNSCHFITFFFVLDNLKCPGVTQNHEIINLVKPCHIEARTGS